MIETRSDPTPPVRNIGNRPTEATQETLFGAGYVSRVYRTTLIVWVVLAMFLGSHFGLPAFIGLTLGTAIGVGSLWLLEMTVVALLHPGMGLGPMQIALLLNLKLPFLTIILAGATWAAMAGVANIFALVGGLTLVQGIIVLKAVGASLLSLLPPLESIDLRLRQGAKPAAEQRSDGLRGGRELRPAGRGYAPSGWSASGD